MGVRYFIEIIIFLQLLYPTSQCTFAHLIQTQLMSALSSAVLIGRSRLSDTSLIIHWSSPEHGLIKTVAKGALQPKSAFYGQLDLFITAEIRWVAARRSDLHTLAEVQWQNPRLQLRQSYDRVLAATYLVKLMEMLIEPEAPVPSIHELLGKALDYLDGKEPSLALIERFELRLAEELGMGGGSGRPISQLQASVQRALPVQRRQLLQRLRSS
jgi:DNA repair protein RecO (recombination protein O)